MDTIDITVHPPSGSNFDTSLAKDQDRDTESQHVDDNTAAMAETDPLQADLTVLPTAPDLLRDAPHTQRLPDGEPHLVIEPLDRDFERAAIQGWTEYEHPDGHTYAFHGDTHVLTTADIHIQKVLQDLMSCYEQIRRRAMKNQVEFPEDAYLMLDYEYGRAGAFWVYYFVDMKRRSLFWVEEFDVKALVTKFTGPLDKSHLSNLVFLHPIHGTLTSRYMLGHRMLTEYWDHWLHFPGLYLLWEPSQ